MTTGIVYWSNLEPGGPRRTAERGLTDVLPYLQALVAEALATRQTPRLTLYFDENIERAARLGELFAKLARERGELPDPAAPPVEVDNEGEDDDEDDDEDDTDKPKGKGKDDEPDTGDKDVEGDDD